VILKIKNLRVPRLPADQKIKHHDAVPTGLDAASRIVPDRALRDPELPSRSFLPTVELPKVRSGVDVVLLHHVEVI